MKCCLGIKSPFIEFSNEIEVLANNSVPLNITKDEQTLMQQEGLRKLGTFIKPVDLRDSTTGFVKADLTKKIPSAAARTSSSAYYSGRSGGGDGGGGGIVMAQRRRHPIQEEMDQKQIILLDEDTDENGLPTSLTDEDRKFIVPMALKNASPDPRTLMATQRLVATTTTRPTTTTTTIKRPTTPPTPEFASNIDDLKKHILFLQNLTKHDSNFQSKFVVFPSLQKERTKQGPIQGVVTTTTVRPFRSIFQYSPPATPPTRKSAFPSGAKLPSVHQFGGYYHNDDEDDGGMSVFLSQAGINANARDKITIVPQVLLLNDQTTKNDTNGGGDVRQRNFDKSPAGMPQSMPAPTTTSTTTTSTTTTTPATSTTPRRPTKKPLCIRNPDSPKCIRQRKREEQQRQRHREQLLREQREYLRPHYEPYAQTLNNTKRFAVSIEIPDSFKIPYNETADSTTTTSSLHVDESELQLLSRSIRSHHKRRNIGGGVQGRRSGSNKFSAKYGASYFERDSVMTGGPDFVASSDQFAASSSNSNSTPSPTVAAYSEPIDLNPDNCYQVDGMTYGQKKQCVLHTSVMPAISRGARAAIQECQFQFKNRRWNCSTIEDNTVFGPMTGLGSPEMAFIHALSAAMVTSFIARACRDGQLASCGCSRGSRPKQLHDDWTWGGCGDNLEYAYKFATDFIDVREKETRRGTRGAGNPERKRGGGGRFHQRRNQQIQAMQADDAAATGGAIMTTTTTPTTTTTKYTASRGGMAGATVQLEAFVDDATSTTNEHISREHGNMQQEQQIQQQLNSNKTVSVDGNQGNDGNKNLASNNTNMSTATLTASKDTAATTTTATTKPPPVAATATQQKQTLNRSNNNNKKESNRDADSYDEDATAGRIKPEDLLELQERITKEILNSKLQGKEMLELQEKINREILNSKVFNVDAGGGGNGNGNGKGKRKRRRKNQRAVIGMANDQQADDTSNGAGGDGAGAGEGGGGKWKNGITAKARSLMNLHNNEAGRRAVIKKTRITCKCHGVSGSCSLITCWQQLSSIREIGDYLREKYEESTEVKLNKRGRLQVKDPQFKVPTAHDLVYLDESPDWCRNSRQLQWPGTHGRICNKTSSGLDGCGILCCGRGYNTKNIVVRERCNCKFHWCCQVKCDVCTKVLEEHTCK